MIIDIHSHIVERTYLDELTGLWGLTAQSPAPGLTLLRKDGHTQAWYKDEMFDTGHRLREMDRKGIDMRVLSLSTPNVYGWEGGAQIRMARAMNDATSTLCKAHPDRFSGLASLPMGDVDASLVELERAMGEPGMVGVMIGSNVAGLPMNHERFEPIWERINQLRLPVIEHPMFPANTDDMEEFELPLRLGFVFDTTLAVARMIYGGIFERYPDFPYVMAHTGGALLTVIQRLDNGYHMFPDCREHISKPPSHYAKRLFYDTASFFTPALKMALDYVGAGQLLWGSDDPFIDADTTHVTGLGLPKEQESQILGGNAARLLGLES
ncbi:MAG: amidohydrolase family protein [Rhodospirillales bacterium]|nr:amidohydrolase family protein [Rhodospirillales bacterium]